MKLTWDGSGGTGTNVYIEVSGNNYHFIYFSGSSGTTTGKEWGGVMPTLPFNAQYVIYLEPWTGGANTGCSWNGGTWNTTFSTSYIAHDDGVKAKTISVSFENLSDQSSISWCAFAQATAGNWLGGYVPSTASTSGYPSSTDSEILTEYYSYSSSVWGKESMNPNSIDYSLPVTLTSFDATNKKGAIELTWVTESEIDNLGFLIERAVDGSAFEEIANFKFDEALRGQGSTTARTDYIWVDKQVVPGMSYEYVLADVDINQKVVRHTDHSVRIKAELNNEQIGIASGFKLANVAPKPFNPSTEIHFALNDELANKPYTVTRCAY